MQPSFDISIIIPAKDEALRLPRFLAGVISYCRQSRLRYEIIVVDDGSTDDTTAKALAFKNDFPDLKVLTLPHNRGKGYAVKRGLFASSGHVSLFLDADGSTPVEEIERNLPLLSQGYDIVIGSRVLHSPDRAVKTKAYRKLMGIVFNRLVHTFLIKNIQDTQCGFKMFRQDIIRPLWARVYLNGFGFDLEMLYVSQQLNLKVKEVPVQWTHVDGSKISILKDSLRMMFNIFQIRNWHYIPINTRAEHMSVTELANMYKQEKEHWWFRAKGEFMRAICAKGKVTPRKVLDAGCGTGHNMGFLQNQAFYVGCDIAHEALSFCKVNGISNLAQCNLEQMSFKPKSFDTIMALDVIEHVQDPYTVVGQLKKLLTDDGTIIVTVPAFRFLWSPHDESLSHMRRYNRQDLLDLLTDAGFEVKLSGYFFCSTFLPVAVIRIIRKIFVKNEDATCDTFTTPNRFVNAAIFFKLWMEAKLLRICPLPFGTSLYALARKNKGKDGSSTVAVKADASTMLNN